MGEKTRCTEKTFDLKELEQQEFEVTALHEFRHISSSGGPLAGPETIRSHAP